MGEETGITWTDSTFNGWIGCAEISPECDNCYAREQNKFHKWNGGTWGDGAPRKVTSEHNWNELLRWDRKAREAGVRKKVFCFSLADVFDREAPLWPEGRQWPGLKGMPTTDRGLARWMEVSRNYQTLSARDVFFHQLVAHLTNLDVLLLTKRPAQARDYLTDLWGSHPWPHVWVGVSAGSQRSADAFIPILMKIPAALRWISHEPVIDHIEWLRSAWSAEAFGEVSHPSRMSAAALDAGASSEFGHHPKIGWIVSGGESGYQARSVSDNEFRSTKMACDIASIPWFMKQMGTQWSMKHYGKGSQGFKEDFAGKEITEWPHDLRVHDFPESLVAV